MKPLAVKFSRAHGIPFLVTFTLSKHEPVQTINMRITLLFIVMSFGLSCIITHNIHDKKYPLNGQWEPIQQTMGGKILPMLAMGHQNLTMSDTTYTLVAESTDKGMVRYANGKMDIYGRDGVNAGKHFMAIYKLENEQLTICYDLTGKVYPESYATEKHPLYFLSVFKRSSKN